MTGHFTMFNYMLQTCEEELSQKLVKECLRSHVMPFIIGDERKAEYYECLNNVQLKGDYEPLIRFFGEEQARYSQMVRDFICPVSKEKSTERKQDRER